MPRKMPRFVSRAPDIQETAHEVEVWGDDWLGEMKRIFMDMAKGPTGASSPVFAQLRPLESRVSVWRAVSVLCQPRR